VLTRLRRAVEHVQADRKDVWLDGTWWVDIADVETLALDASAADPDEVLDVVQGEFLDGIELVGAELFSEWVTATRAHLRSVTSALLGAVVTRALAGDDSPTSGIMAARRVLALEPTDEAARGLVHVLLVIAQLAAAAGATRLLTAALPSGTRIAGPGAEEVALGLALVVVALPSWLALWVPTRRRLAEDATERASTGWALHAAAAATTALVVTVVQAIAVGTWWAGVGGAAWQALATFVVWGGVCAAWTWFLARSGLAPAGPLGGLVSLAGSAVGVVTFAIGAVGIVAFGLDQLLHAVAGPALVDGASTAPVRRGLATAAVGASSGGGTGCAGASRRPATGSGTPTSSSPAGWAWSPPSSRRAARWTPR
jgi:hypothetical protein